MEIKFLKAGTGDCICINIDSKNIIIDGGNDSTFLIERYNEICNSKEKIDVLIVTHHDDDHIMGILDLFKYIEKKNETPLIDSIIFNSPKILKSKLKINDEGKYLSYKQANELENLIFKHKSINFYTSNENTTREFLNGKFDELEVVIFSPSDEILYKYANNKGAYLTSDFRCDWAIPFKNLEKNIDDKSQDTSASNETSIVVLLKYRETKILLTSDVTPNRLNNILDLLRGENEKVDIDFMKLPHHGSYRSLNSEILNKINCKNYIISTNGSKHFLPNKRVILKIMKSQTSNNEVDFLFNYGDVISKLNISRIELNEKKINLKPNNMNCGYVINL